MRHKILTGLAAVLIASSLVAEAHGSADAESSVLETGQVAGASLGTWTARWWQWALSQWITPYMDPDGRVCEVGQTGAVWFLAGTDGSYTANRTCAVPMDTYVLLPIINMLYKNPIKGNQRPCAALQVDAAVNNDHIVSAVVLLDGHSLGDIKTHRVRSGGCFQLDQGEETPQLAAADGYWLMLKPLSRGRHTLTVGANYGAAEKGYGAMQQNFEYVLDVGGPTLLGLQRSNHEIVTKL
ncbi:MAG: hypothetical protein ABJA62_12050 [Luteimonas sp.]